MRGVLLWLSTLAVVLLYGVVSARADMLVWSENAIVKVRPNDFPKATPAGIIISAARNEYESFQIIIRPQGGLLRGLDVDLGDFVSGGKDRIACRENCTIYRELYIQVVRPSGPYGSVGEWPDALIPKVDRYAGEKRNAFPYDVPENRNQPVWIDVYVPPAAPPGVYIAYASVRAQGEQTIRIPVYLTVFGFSLPATSSIRNSFLVWPTALPLAHGLSFVGETLDQLTRTYSKALLAHRLSNGALLGNLDWLPTPLIQPSADSLAKLRKDWGPFFDGSLLPNGARITAATPSDNLCLTGTLCRQDVIDFFATAGWLQRMAVYLPDEPNLTDPNVLQQVKSIADTIHQRDERLRTLLTNSYSEQMQPETDIWVVPLPALQKSFEDGSYGQTYAQEIARGKEVWVYQACFEHDPACGWNPWYPGLSGWPDYMIDMQGMKNRIQDWINWKFRVQGELYWGVNYGYYVADPFASQFLAGGNGEGNFFYPGTPERIGGRTHIPIESIRLKLKREGLEDYEYLSLLARNGDLALADSKAAELVRSARDWEQDPDVLYRVRSEIAAQLELVARKAPLK